MRDPKVEKWLDKLLVKWNYVESMSLSYISFDNDSRNSNQVRFNLIDEQNYHNILESRKSGDEMNAILVNETQESTYILDGNHRYATAIDTKMKTLDVYVVRVESGSDLELQLMLEPNTRLASKRLEENEAARWAIYLNTHFKLTQAEIARRVGLKPSQVSNAISAHKAFLRAQKVLKKDRQAFNAWSKLNPTIQKILNRIPNDVGLRYAIEVTTGYKLNSDQVQRLFQSVSESGTDEDALKCIDKFLDDETSKNTADVKKGAGREKPAWDFLKMHAGAVRNVSPDRVLRELMSGTLDNKQVGDLKRYLIDARDVVMESLEAVNEYESSLGKFLPAKKAATKTRSRGK